jgi:hypothetical protein
MNANFAEQFLNDQIPLKYRRLFPPTLKRAYAIADALIASSPVLEVPSAADNRGRIISWAVDFSVKGLIESQEWPVDYRWQVFSRPTGRYLEIILPHAAVSISQVAFWRDQPRNVQFRENARLGNQQFTLPGIEGGDDEVGEAEEASGRVSFLLVHGYKELEFAHFGIPHRYHERGYIYQSPNLMRLPYSVDEPLVPPPEQAIDIDKLMSFKEDIERWQRDNGET